MRKRTDMHTGPARRKRRGGRAQFAAPMGAGVKNSSALLLVLMASVVVTLLWVMPRKELWAAILALCMVVGIFGGVALFSVRGYSVEPRTLRIRRPLWDTEIPLAGLRRACADPEAFKRAWRVAGNGGFLGYTGWFRSKRLGSFRAYVTDMSRSVVLEFEQRKIVVSPDDPRRFLEALGFAEKAEGGTR